MDLRNKLARGIFYGGISREEYLRVSESVAESNHRALTHWSILVSFFWIYCLLMSLRAADYAMCRPAYTGALAACIFCYLCARFLVPRVPKALFPLTCLFRLSLLGGGIGIAVCQWNARSLTMFAVAIVAPSIFIDSTVNSLGIHLAALAIYVAMGRNVIAPDIYSWGLGNFILFSVFGLLIGNAINKERFERYVFADSSKKLAEMQARYAYYDQMTGLKNRRAYSEKLHTLSREMPPACCVVMIDINGLKQMNDSFGHEAGDELIIGASECIRAAFPGTEDIYRLGGDEFCVILPEDEPHAERCLATLERVAGERRGCFVRGIALACGMASDRDAADIEAIAKEADARMYESKRRYYSDRQHDRRRKG